MEAKLANKIRHRSEELEERQKAIHALDQMKKLEKSLKSKMKMKRTDSKTIVYSLNRFEDIK